MIKIDLQHKTKPKVGRITYHWFENPNISLPLTRFHTIEIPLKLFNSGIEYEHQPVETSLLFEWIKLEIDDPLELDRLEINSQKFPDMEASMYLGAAHNWMNVCSLKISFESNLQFRVNGIVEIDFETEGVAENETFMFSAITVMDQ
jgi:hypothetical protein